MFSILGSPLQLELQRARLVGASLGGCLVGFTRPPLPEKQPLSPKHGGSGVELGVLLFRGHAPTPFLTGSLLLRPGCNPNPCVLGCSPVTDLGVGCKLQQHLPEGGGASQIFEHPCTPVSSSLCPIGGDYSL